MGSGRPRVGISACLLGERVRYDGGHKRDAFLADVLGGQVEWVPVCPEVEAGMGTPREPVQLVRSGEDVRMVGVTSHVDHTDTMRRWSAARLDELARADLSGYVLKSRSPSCGLAVPVIGAEEEATGRGLFAEALLERLPSLPIEEESRLSDPQIRERFLERVLAYRRLMER